MYNLIEIKARSKNSDKVRRALKDKNAEYKGIDHQIDTYFNVAEGRLKLREGNIENNLIHYHRPDIDGPKNSLVTLYKSNPESTLKEVLTKALGIKVVVKKQREIYFINNVKFHIDEVDSLGSFIEIEAIGIKNDNTEELRKQCTHYMQLLEVKDSDLVTNSYSDLLMKANNS